MKTHLILSGGGVYGVYMLGCLDVLLKKHKFTHICGTSIGSVIGVLISFMSISDIMYILQEQRIITDDDIDIKNVYINFGLIQPVTLLQLIKKCFSKYLNIENPTFKEFLNKTKKYIFITGTNLTKNSLDIFNVSDHPDMSILTAIEISISIPLLFTKVTYNNNVYVDGGVTCMYPSKVYKNIDNKKQFCIYIVPPNVNSDLSDPKAYIMSIISTLIKSQSNNDDNIDKIIIDNNVYINLVDYKRSDIEYMFNYGKDKANDFLKKTN
jgi:predicted acylesterase/phospholipase RssA